MVGLCCPSSCSAITEWNGTFETPELKVLLASDLAIRMSSYDDMAPHARILYSFSKMEIGMV